MKGRSGLSRLAILVTTAILALAQLGCSHSPSPKTLAEVQAEFPGSRYEGGQSGAACFIFEFSIAKSSMANFVDNEAEIGSWKRGPFRIVNPDTTINEEYREIPIDCIGEGSPEYRLVYGENTEYYFKIIRRGFSAMFVFPDENSILVFGRE